MKVTKEKQTFYVIAIEQETRDVLVDALNGVATNGGQGLNMAERSVLDELRVAILNEG